MPQIEKREGRSTPITTMWPWIIGGICEYCGVIDNNLPSEEQYKLCPHFKAIGNIECSYCDPTVDPVDNMRKSAIKVHQSPTNPESLVVVCDKFTCTDKHIKRFQINS